MEKKSPKLEEDYKKFDLKKAEEKISSNNDLIKKLRREQLVYRLNKIYLDFVYIFIISCIIGFFIYSWFPENFSFIKPLSGGLVFYVLFEELQLHRMFKNG